MTGELHLVRRDISPASEDCQTILIADKNGSIVGSHPLVIPRDKQDGIELMLPEAFEEAAIAQNNGTRIILPNSEGSAILPDKYNTLLSASVEVDTATVMGKLAAEVEHGNEIVNAKEVQEKAEETAARQLDIAELTNNPEEFLIRKTQERLETIDQDVWNRAEEDQEFYLTALQVLQDSYIQKIKGDFNLYVTLSEIVRYCRLVDSSESTTWGERGESASERLIDQLIMSLDTATPKERQGIYDIIGQFDMPLEVEEKILWRMEERNEYKQSLLAARYALHQYDHNREGEWVKAQTERQGRLRSLVDVSPDVAMEQFDESMRLAHKIVFSTDPRALPEGKIGMEFEGGDKYGKKEEADMGTISCLEWDVGTDIDVDYYLEVRKTDERLDFSSYPDALVELDPWAADYFTSSPYDRYKPRMDRTMHIHLDRKRHPHEPLWGLYDDELLENDHGTWEIRSVIPFHSAAETLAFTELAIYSTSGDKNTQPDKFLSIDDISSWQKLLYGHIVHSTENPAARMAALVALRDPYAMRGFSIYPLLDTYGTEVLELLNQRPDDFLMTGSPSHYGELYALSTECNTSRDPEKLYDIAMNLSASDESRNMAISLMVEDPLAHHTLVRFLQSDVAYDCDHVWRVLRDTNKIGLELGLVLFAKALKGEPGIDERYQRRMLEKLLAYPAIFDQTIAMLCNSDIPIEERISTFERLKPALIRSNSASKLLHQHALPDVLQDRLTEAVNLNDGTRHPRFHSRIPYSFPEPQF